MPRNPGRPKGRTGSRRRAPAHRAARTWRRCTEGCRTCRSRRIRPSREPDSTGLGEQAHAARLARHPLPVVGLEVVGAVDVDVVDAEATQVCEVRAHAVHSASRIGLELDRNLELDATCRTDHGSETKVFGRTLAPPRANHLVDAGGGDVPHLVPEDPRVSARVGAPGREEVGGDVERRQMAPLGPVRVCAVVAWVRIPGVEEDRAPRRTCPGGGRQRQSQRKRERHEWKPHRA